MQRMKIKANLLAIIFISVLLVPGLWTEISLGTNKIGRSAVASSNEVNAEIERLSALGEEQCEKGQFNEAVHTFNEQLNLAKTLKNPKFVGDAFAKLGYVHNLFDENQKSIEFYLQALDKFKLIDDQSNIALTFQVIGDNYSSLGNNSEALRNYEQALVIYQSIGSKSSEITVLSNIGSAFSVLGNKQKALEYFKNAQILAGTIYDQSALASAYFDMGGVYEDLGDKQKALINYEQALLVYKSSGDKQGESMALRSIGNVVTYMGNKNQAMIYFSQSAEISKLIDDRTGLAEALSSISYIHSSLGDKQKAINNYQEVLRIYKSLNNTVLVSETLTNIGDLYAYLGNKQQALKLYKEANALSEKVNDQTGEAATSYALGDIYFDLGERQQALTYYEKALSIYKSVDNKSGESIVLNKKGYIYLDFNEKQKALDCYKQSLSIAEAIQDKFMIARVNLSLGDIYSGLQDTSIALGFYQISLETFKETNNSWGIAESNRSIGSLYFALKENKDALTYFEKALNIYKATNYPQGEAKVLENIGNLYFNLGDEQQALDFFGQSLALYKELSSRNSEVGVLNDLSQTAIADNRPELGIFFLKQAVSTIQSLRHDISQLPKSVRKTFANTSANSYRQLAILLLEKGRILEAQQVLDLLKIDEIDEYFRNNQRGRPQTQEVVYVRSEQSILEKYNELSSSLISISQKLAKLKSLSIHGQKLSTEQEAQLVEYDKIQTDVRHKFKALINNPDVEQKLAQASNAQQQQIPLDLFERLRKNLTKLGNAALVYPLVLPDRIELIITTADSPSVYRTVKVSQIELNQAILDYRDALQFPNLDPKIPANKLYRWLIEPLEADFAQAHIRTILYAPDGPLRYIPLAALYDGKQWIAQRFAVNNLTAVSITDLEPSTPGNLRVMAGAYANEKLSYRVQVGNQAPITYHGLPFAGQEVNDLAATVPNTDKHIDQAFSLKNLKPLFSEYNVLHFATHAVFFPGRPEYSFILFGDGEQASLNSISDWSLNGVDLVVLSACDSGLGIDSSLSNPTPKKTKLGSGSEILGLGYQFQHSGAKATIASLWAVDDGGTQSLMSAFYKLLAQGNITKAEALRQAQVQLITGKVHGQGNQDLSDPHYWAPFFLIGNGL